MFIYLNKKGQSTLEYGVVIAIIVAGLIAMQAYIKRGVQGRLKQASDDIGEQFSPGYTTGTYTTRTSVASNEAIVPTQVGNVWVSTTTTDSNQTQDRDVTENVATSNQEYWK